jgi:TRAP-type mannitol/chloroaromatic compound transport system permease small subunit
MDSYSMNEISENPGGLPYRWLIKGMIPLAFGILIIFALGYTVKNINLYRMADAGVKKHLHGSLEEGR